MGVSMVTATTVQHWLVMVMDMGSSIHVTSPNAMISHTLNGQKTKGPVMIKSVERL